MGLPCRASIKILALGTDVSIGQPLLLQSLDKSGFFLLLWSAMETFSTFFALFLQLFSLVSMLANSSTKGM
jgi:hypothetical protein